MRIILACRQMTVILFKFSETFSSIIIITFSPSMSLVTVFLQFEFNPENKNKCWGVAKVSIWDPLVVSLFPWAIVSFNHGNVSAIVTFTTFLFLPYCFSPLYHISLSLYGIRMNPVVFKVSNNLLLSCKYTCKKNPTSFTAKLSSVCTWGHHFSLVSMITWVP